MNPEEAEALPYFFPSLERIILSSVQKKAPPAKNNIKTTQNQPTLMLIYYSKVTLFKQAHGNRELHLVPMSRRLADQAAWDRQTFTPDRYVECADARSGYTRLPRWCDVMQCG